jgi:predicted transcriptional regulator
MDDKFIVKPNTTESTTLTIRIDKDVIARFDDLAIKSGHSRNSLINMALHYALENLKFEGK